MIKKNLQMKKVVVVVCMALAMLCGSKSAVAQPIEPVGLEDFNNVFSPIYTYVWGTPQNRAYDYLLDTLKWSEIDMAIVLKDLQTLFNKMLDSAAYSHDSPYFITDTAIADVFYNEIIDSPIDYRDSVTNVTLPAEVVEAMKVALSDSSDCTECPSSTATSGNNNKPKMICKATFNSALLILNAYFSCTPRQRVLFYNTYCCYPCGDPPSPCDYTNKGEGGNSDCDAAYWFLSKYGRFAQSDDSQNTTGADNTMQLDQLFYIDIMKIDERFVMDNQLQCIPW